MKLLESLGRYLVSRYGKGNAAEELLARQLAGDSSTTFVSAMQESFDVSKAAEMTVWVYAAVKFIANEAIQAPLQTMVPSQEQDEEGQYPYLPADIIHPLNVLLRRPNPFLDAAFYWLRSWWILLLHGRCYHVIERTNPIIRTLPNELWCFGPAHVQPIVAKGRIQYYQFVAEGYEAKIPISEVIDIKFPNPLSPYDGLSPILPVRYSVAGDQASQEYNQAFFQNDATPGIALEVPGALDPGTRKRMKADWEREHRGRRNAFRLAILENGATVEQLGLNQSDMQFIEGQKMSRTRIAVAYGIPPLFLGDYESSTYDNLATARKIAWQQGVKPVLEITTSAISQQIGDEYPEKRGEVEYPAKVIANTSAIPALQEEQKEKDDRFVAISRAGVAVNDALAYIYEGKKIPPQPGGNQVWKPLSEVPIGSIEEVPGREGGKSFF